MSTAYDVTAQALADRLARIREERHSEALKTLKHRLRFHILPYLKRMNDQGFPGLSERDRSEMLDSLWSVQAALTDLESL